MNRLLFHAVQPLADVGEATLRLRLGTFARSTSTSNTTSEAPAIIYVVVLIAPVTANYFGLVTPGVREPEIKVMLVTVPLWFLSLRTIWRAKLFDRLLTVGDRS